MDHLQQEDSCIEKLFKLREPPSCALPEKAVVESFAGELLAVLFPHFARKPLYTPEDLEVEFELLKRNLYHILRPLECGLPEHSREHAERFFYSDSGDPPYVVAGCDRHCRGRSCGQKY